MREELLNSYALVLADARRLLADVSDDRMASQPIEGMNHPAWIIGHVVYSFQMIGIEMGLAPWLPEGWADRFRTDSTPVSDRSAYPAKCELLGAFDDAAGRIRRRLAAMDDRDLAGPIPDVRYRQTFPTLGHAVLHILTVHTCVHLGQLSAWRRATGVRTPA